MTKQADQDYQKAIDQLEERILKKDAGDKSEEVDPLDTGVIIKQARATVKRLDKEKRKDREVKDG